MSKIQLSLSSKCGSDNKRQIMIRLFEGSRINLRGKSRIFISDEYFQYNIDVKETAKRGILIPSGAMATQKEAERKGYVLCKHGNVEIPPFRKSTYVREKPLSYIDAEASRDQLKALIDEVERHYRTVDKSQVNSAWLEGIINYFHNKELIEENERREREEAEAAQRESRYVLYHFRKFIDSAIVGKPRKKAYEVTYKILSRFLTIKGYGNLSIDEFGPDHILELDWFIANEYEYANKKRWQYLYKGLRKNNVPTTRRDNNTTAKKLQIFKTFFTALEDKEEINKSPFKKLTKETCKNIVNEQYAKPFSLTIEELRNILTTNVPSHLIETKEAFTVQCALGCRINEFKLLSMPDVAIMKSREGHIPYIHYLPTKTQKKKKILEEIKTPIVRYAFDIIREKQFSFKILRNISGEKGYNKKIKELLRYCGITREVEVRDKATNTLKRVAIHEEASSKLARKTYISLMNRVQINPNLGGLHAMGSKAIEHYNDVRLEDQFLWLCRAFEEEPYYIDAEFKIIENDVEDH